MGLSKYSYKYLNWGYNQFFSLLKSIVTLFITIVTKSHEPLSRAPKWIALRSPGRKMYSLLSGRLQALGCRASRFQV